MPEPVSKEFNPNVINDQLRVLLEDNLRLHADIEHLLKQQSNSNGNHKKDGEGGDKDQGGGQSGEGDDKEKSEKPEQKPPLRQRAAAWVSAHPLGFILILLGIVVLAVAGFLLLQYLGSYVNTDDAEIDGHINQISSRIAGTVTGVYVENNRSVTQNQTLIDLDPRDYQTALSREQANLAQTIGALEAQAPNVPITQVTESTNASTARLEVANAEAALQSAIQVHEAALADLRQAQASAANAAAEEERYRRLADKQEVSREIYDRWATASREQAALVASRRASGDAAEKTIEQRQNALDEARERQKEVESNVPRQIAVQHANVASRRANVEAARAGVFQAGLNLTYIKILAPVNGIVGDKTVEVGQHVVPGQELLAITQTDDLWVTANFKETQIQQMHPGQRVTIHVDAVDLDFEGYVQNMAGATGARYSLLPPENATGNYVKVVQRLPVRIHFKPDQRQFGRLRPGMSVEPKVWLK